MLTSESKILLKQWYNKIVSSNPHPKGGEHYTMVPWQIKYNGGRLSPTPGKWFLVGISDSEAGYRRQGIRHFLALTDSGSNFEFAQAPRGMSSMVGLYMHGVRMRLQFRIM